MKVLSICLMLALATACGGDDGGSPGATREEAAAVVCDCLLPGLSGADRDACIMTYANEFEMNMCSQACMDCWAAADTCQEVDEGCETECTCL